MGMIGGASPWFAFPNSCTMRICRQITYMQVIVKQPSVSAVVMPNENCGGG